MAKKQQIILTHGSVNPSAEVIKDLKLGEVLVQHADAAVDAQLHTLLKEGSDDAEPVLVSFPSKDYVDAEIAKVDAGGINDTIEGIETRVGAIEKDYLKAADKNELNTAIGNEATARENADNAINAKFGAGIGTGENEKTVADAIAAEASARETADNGLLTAIDAKVAQADYNAKVGEIDAAIDGLEELLDGYEGKGSVKAAVDAKVAQSVYDTKVAEIDGKLGGLQTAIDELDATYATNKELQDVKDELDADVLAAKTTLTTAEPEAGVKVAKTEAEDGHANYEVTAVGLATTKELDAVEERINTIVGQVEGDDGKSMRAVAKEEVDSFKDLLYGEGTADVIDTLQDVINWIDSDESGATKIVADIAELQKVTSGYEGEKAIQTAFNGLDARVVAIEGDYLKAADKNELNTAIGNEATARENADNAIEAKLGAGFDAEKTVAAAIAAEASARETADNGLQNAIDTLAGKVYTEDEIDAILGEGFDAEHTVAAAVDAATTTLTEAAPTEGVKVVKTVAEDGHANYEVTAVGLATTTQLNGVDTRVGTLEGSYVKEVVANGVSYKPEANVLDLSALVIDGGTY